MRLYFAYACVGLLGIGWLGSGSLPAQGPVRSMTGNADGEWPSYAADLASTHYSPLDQINGANFGQLEVAWRFKTDSLGPRPEYKLEGTPLMVGGILYTTGGTRRAAIALDARTGELIWAHSEREGARSAASPRQLSGRGVAYWTDGRDERILYTTIGYQLVELDAKTGARVPSFGAGGIVELKDVAVFGNRQPIDRITGEIGVHQTPTVTRSGVVMVGSSFREGGTPRTHNNTKGLVQAFDVKTGRRLWVFNTIPRPGEFGNDTWLNDSWAVNGNVGVWNQISVDEELGLAYLPVETPTSDFYGGHRPGNNLFADSIVAVDVKTGQRKWHYQLVHHSLWNFDVSAAPILADITVNGRPIKAVLVMTKAAMMYVLDRATGQPVWPIEERPVPKGDVPGEWYSPTQPFPTRPKPYDLQGVTEDALIDFTPELRQQALRNVAKYKLGPIFTPPPVSRLEGPLAGFRSSGGTNWPGASYDPDTHVAYVPSFKAFPTVALMRPPNREFSDVDWVQGFADRGVIYVTGPGEDAGADAPVRGAARPAAAPGVPVTGAPAAAPTTVTGEAAQSLNPQGLPLLKPPYGQITAIDMNTGEFMWQTPHGETPDAVRNHPALQGLNVPRTGQAAATGVLVTKTLVIAGDPQATVTAGHPRGAMLRAYDKASGREVGAVYMAAPQSGTPMTYRVDGRQYIVVPISGGNASGEYVAYALR
ncbi:MAG TPA: PQQ-binding-like beta-propeller repeat protein [Vicinamibacterales bacterium]|nr:PQQ-binding-like beta-propeller repeat protein [Vicinamibacterales bacterium]